MAEGSDLRRRLGRFAPRLTMHVVVWSWQREAISVGDLDMIPWGLDTKSPSCGRGKRSPSETWTGRVLPTVKGGRRVAEGSDLRRRLGHDLRSRDPGKFPYVAEGSDLRRRLGQAVIRVGQGLGPGGRGKRSPSETWTKQRTTCHGRNDGVAEGSDLRRRLGHRRSTCGF